MAKFLILTVLVCAIVASAYAGPGGFGRPNNNRRPGGGGGGGGGGKDRWSTKICANSSLTQPFLTQTQQVFSTLQANGSYGAVLQKRAQEVAYIQSATTAPLISSNCTEYFNGLNTARQNDRLAEQQQRQLEQNVVRLIAQVIQSLVGGFGGYDSSEGF